MKGLFVALHTICEQQLTQKAVSHWTLLNGILVNLIWPAAFESVSINSI
jgi:hypothetical protein